MADPSQEPAAGPNIAPALAMGGMFLGALGVQGLAAMQPEARDPLLKTLGWLPKQLGTTAALFPFHVARGLFADTNAIAHPEKYTVLKDPAQREAWSKVTGAVSDYHEARGKYHQAKRRVAANQQEAFAHYAQKGQPAITGLARSADGQRVSVSSAGSAVPAETVHGLQYKPVQKYLAATDELAQHQATMTASKQLFRENFGSEALPMRALLNPSGLFRGLRGVASGTSGKSLTELAGHAMGRGITQTVKAAPRLALGLGNDLVAGAGHDLLGLKKVGWGQSSTLIRGARLYTAVKGLAPLVEEARKATLASEDTFAGNPMLSSLANQAHYRANHEAFDDAYGSDTGPGLRGSPHDAARQRFVESSVGLAHSLSKLGGRVL